MDEYYLWVYHRSNKIQVSKQEYVDAERSLGFYNSQGKPTEPATAGFGKGPFGGFIIYGVRKEQ